MAPFLFEFTQRENAVASGQEWDEIHYFYSFLPSELLGRFLPEQQWTHDMQLLPQNESHLLTVPKWLFCNSP